jgi:hypothetical protein
MERDVIEGLEKANRWKTWSSRKNPRSNRMEKMDAVKTEMAAVNRSRRKTGGSRGPGSDRIRDLDRGGKTREQSRDR